MGSQVPPQPQSVTREEAAEIPTSLPAPGRKVFTLMVFPGAGKGDSMRLLMKG